MQSIEERRDRSRQVQYLSGPAGPPEFQRARWTSLGNGGSFLPQRPEEWLSFGVEGWQGAVPRGLQEMQSREGEGRGLPRGARQAHEGGAVHQVCEERGYPSFRERVRTPSVRDTPGNEVALDIQSQENEPVARREKVQDDRRCNLERHDLTEHVHVQHRHQGRIPAHHGSRGQQAFHALRVAEQRLGVDSATVWPEPSTVFLQGCSSPYYKDGG